ncbi:uncharacterized protein [Ptychodera flava]|uniref:uncharacterized protein n=1 Tax=Ptychodera flava TaxID=63121 RepID=UPI00396A0DDB
MYKSITIAQILFLLLNIGSDSRGSSGDPISTLPCSFDILVPENTPVDQVVFTFPHNQTKIHNDVTFGTPTVMDNSSTIFSDFKCLSIVEGNKNDRFQLDAETGDISIKGYLDRSIDPQYILAVLLQNNQNLSQLTCIVNITLEDVDGWPPYYNETCEMPTREPHKGFNIPLVIYLGSGKLTIEDISEVHLGKRFKGDMNNDKCMATIFSPMRMLYPTVHLDLRRSNFNIMVDTASSMEANYSIYLKREDFPENSLFEEEWFSDVIFSGHKSPMALIKTVITNIDTRSPSSLNFHIALLVDHKLEYYFDFLVDIIGCPKGTYGAKCDKHCICKNDADCHVFNGACKCKPGWFGPACDIPKTMVVLSSKEEEFAYGDLLLLKCTTKNIQWSEENDEWKERISWFFNGEYLNFRNLQATEKGYRITSQTVGVSILESIWGFTDEMAGVYTCEARDENGNVCNDSATVVAKCRNNLFGRYCNMSCDCKPASSTSCDRYRGCLCNPGWTGRHCHIDTILPTFKGCPKEITKVIMDGERKANVTWLIPTVKDNSENVTLYSSHAPGDVFQVGTTIVQYTATDSANNTVHCRFRINVLYRSKMPIGLIIGMIATFLFLLLLLFFCLAYRRLQLYSLTADMDIDHSDDDMEYDAFVLFSSSDEDFAEDIMQHLEKSRNYRLLLHHRDFVAGRAILDNIEDSFDVSRTAILVISPNFLESGMCMHEARIALDNWINRRQKLIPIVEADIEHANISKSSSASSNLSHTSSGQRVVHATMKKNSGKNSTTPWTEMSKNRQEFRVC